LDETEGEMKGHLYAQNGSWCVRWSETKDGKRVNHFAKIATLVQYPRKREVKPAFEEFVRKAQGAATSNVSSGITVAAFVENHYLSYAERVKSASTSSGYRGLWVRYVRDHEFASLRVIQVETSHVRRLLLAVQSDGELAKRTCQHLKSFLSGVFTYAKNEGVIKLNPVHETLLPEDAKAPRETYAYDLASIQTMLGVLVGAPKVFIALAGLAGLRLGEIQALRWEDISDDEIKVSRADWKGIIDEPKTSASKASVPVIATLHRILEEYRVEMGGMVQGPLFEMRLEKLAARTIAPIVKGIGLKWHGAHALRRGIATNLYSLGASDKIVQRILRHAKASVTREYYIKSVPEDVKLAMQQLEAKIAGRTLTVHSFGSSTTASA
jgi:integrase